MKKKRKAQSILEYILVLGAIITVVIAVTFGSGGGGQPIVQQAVTDMFTESTDVISGKAAEFSSQVAGGVGR